MKLLNRQYGPIAGRNRGRVVANDGVRKRAEVPATGATGQYWSRDERVGGGRRSGHVAEREDVPASGPRGQRVIHQAGALRVWGRASAAAQVGQRRGIAYRRIGGIVRNLSRVQGPYGAHRC